MPKPLPPNKQSDKKTDRKLPKEQAIDFFSDAPLFAGLESFTWSPVTKQRKKNTTPRKKAATDAATSKKKKNDEPAVVEKKKAPSKPASSEKALLSVADMCKLLSISRATLVRMDNGGKIPGRIKLGGCVRYHRETVETWLAGLAGK